MNTACTIVFVAARRCLNPTLNLIQGAVGRVIFARLILRMFQNALIAPTAWFALKFCATSAMLIWDMYFPMAHHRLACDIALIQRPCGLLRRLTDTGIFMKLLFDLFPVILFFLVFKIAGANPEAAQNFGNAYLSGLVSGGEVSLTQAPILLATAVTILATIAQIGSLLVRRQRVDNMLWVSLVIIVVFGGATIYFHDEQFIKLKPTVLYWCFAIALFVSPFLFKKNLIKSMMSQQLELPDSAWTQLNFAWGGFFSLMGALNLYIAFNYPLEFWVNFKLFGFIGLMIVFVVIQSIYLSRYVKETEQGSE